MASPPKKLKSPTIYTAQSSHSTHHENACSNKIETSQCNLKVNQDFVNQLLTQHSLNLDSHYSSFLMSDKKLKKIAEYFANFEQIVFGQKKFCEKCENVKHADFIEKLKIVLLALLANWPVLTRYQKHDHVAAILLLNAAWLSNLPKRIVLETFKSFGDENFKNLKIRHLKKSKLYTNVQEILKMAFV